jgi:RNA polymerase sigma-70 factor, ECF subfamily
LTCTLGEINLLVTEGSAIASSGPPRLSDQQQEWLADLYRANFASVARLCTGILKNAEDGADAAHETFLIAANSMQPDVSAKVARSWLLTVARNHCLDVLRRRKRYGRALVTLGGNPDNVADIESAIVDRDFANVVLSHLSLRERQALWQSAVESRPMADIATGLQLSYMAAAQVLHRARRHAASTAARFAVVIGGLRLWPGQRRNATRRDLGGLSQLSFLTADRILALAAVPLVVMAVQSSSSPTPAAAESLRRAQSVATTTVAATAPTAGPQLLVPSPSGLGALTGVGSSPLPATGALPPGTTYALSGAAEGVRRAVDQPPVPMPSIPVIPTLPPVSVSPPALPLPTPSLPPIVP